MADHLVAYVQRKLITSWKRNTLKHTTDGKPTFLYSSNDSWQFGPYARGGAVLWVIASHPPDPPALVAKLDSVEQVCVDIKSTEIPERVYHRFGRRLFVVRGGEHSQFFGHNDVSRVLLKLTYLSKSGKRRPLTDDTSDNLVWCSKYGQQLIRPVRIADGDRGASRLRRYAERLNSRTVFISYKRRDHRNKIRRDRMRQFVRELIELGYGVWLDKVALPDTRGPKNQRRQYSQRAQDEMLGTLLQHGLGDSKALVAVSSEHYGVRSESGKRNWTKKEWEKVAKNADRDGTCVPAVWMLYPQTSPDSDVDLSQVEPFSRSRSPKRAARDFDEWFNPSASPPPDT